jgi:hypothetical protein
MVKKKDNLTDVVEQLPPSIPANTPPPPKNQVVVGNDGELVTLGHKPRKSGNDRIKGNSFELSEKIQRMVKEAVEEEMKGFKVRLLKELERKLKEEGLI